MGFIHDTDDPSFNGITVESRSNAKTFVLGLDLLDPDDPLDVADQPETVAFSFNGEAILVGSDSSESRVWLEIKLDNIDAIRKALDLAEEYGLEHGWQPASLPKLPWYWSWEWANGKWQARSTSNVLVGYDADGQLLALDPEGEPVRAGDIVDAVFTANGGAP
jgi:hypothetical protein